jgi:hypothetical protein
MLSQREQFDRAELLIGRLVAEREGGHNRNRIARYIYDTVS